MVLYELGLASIIIDYHHTGLMMDDNGVCMALCEPTAGLVEAPVSLSPPEFR